jgi:hypothetical protein
MDKDIKQDEFKKIEEAEEKKVFDIKDIEIFKVGTWNGQQYTEKDLDDMVDSFSEVGNLIKPYIKLGHNEKQDLLKNDGMPAAGWITGLKRKGESLLANFSNVPNKIFDLIEKKAFGRLSSEIIWNLKMQGKTYRRALKAVALLGANTPAVETLDDFINLYTESDYDDIMICNNYTKGVNNMEEAKILQEQLDELTAQLNEMKEKKEEAENYSKELEDKVAAEKEAAKKSEIDNFIKDAIEDGKILPIQVDAFTALCYDNDEDGLKVYSKDDQIIKTSSFDLVKTIVDNMSKIEELKEESSEEIKKEKKLYSKEVDESKDTILNEKIEVYAKEHNIDYVDAYEKVMMEE